MKSRGNKSRKGSRQIPRTYPISESVAQGLREAAMSHSMAHITREGISAVLSHRLPIGVFQGPKKVMAFVLPPEMIAQIEEISNEKSIPMCWIVETGIRHALGVDNAS